MIKKYVLSEEEIRSLLSGMANLGSQKTYEIMKERMLIMKKDTNDANIDGICMDMYDVMLIRAREFNYEEGDKEGQEIKQILFQIASMFRILAHELHRTNKNKIINTDRFLELVSSNQGNFTFQSK